MDNLDFVLFLKMIVNNIQPQDFPQFVWGQESQLGVYWKQDLGTSIPGTIGFLTGSVLAMLSFLSLLGEACHALIGPRRYQPPNSSLHFSSPQCLSSSSPNKLTGIQFMNLLHCHTHLQQYICGNNENDSSLDLIFWLYPKHLSVLV